MGWILPIARKNNVICIVGRLIIAASSYYIWQERNNRLHVNGSRSVEQLASAILDIVRLKLGTIKFKRNARTYSPTLRKCRRPPCLKSSIAFMLWREQTSAIEVSIHIASCSLPGSTNAMGIETSIALVLPAREHECNGSFKLGRPPALS
ncbi:hypothetical protein Tco_1279993 [Tanacetum coccineum]